MAKLHVRFSERQGVQVANNTDRKRYIFDGETRPDSIRIEDHERSITVQKDKEIGGRQTVEEIKRLKMSLTLSRT